MTAPACFSTNSLIYYRFRFLIILIIIMTSLSAYSQDPVPVLQRSFDMGITDMKISADKKHFITVEGDITTFGGIDIRLWDYESRIVIAEAHFESENGPGSGQILLLDKGNILLSLNHSIIRFNLLTKQKEVLFEVNWPEYIHAFAGVTNDSLIISTKIYPDDDGMISDITNRSNLVLWDFANKKVLKSRTNDFEIPVVTYKVDLNNFLIGTNQGEGILFDPDLNPVGEPLEFFKDKPIRFIHATGTGIVAASPVLPSEGGGYTLDYGQGVLKVLSLKNSAFNKLIELPSQKPPIPESNLNSSLSIGDSNIIKNITLKSDTELLISYGFNRIDVLDLNSLEKSRIGPTDVDFDIGTIILNPNSNEILYSYGPVQILSNPTDIAVYDLEYQRDIYKFPERESVLSKTKILKSIGSDYYFVELFENGFSGVDSLSLQSPVSNEVISVNCSMCEITFNRSGDEWIIKKGTTVFIGEPNNRFIKQSVIDFTFGYDQNYEYKFDQERWFDNGKLFQLENTGKKNYLSSVKHYFNGSDTFLAIISSGKDPAFYALIDKNGSILKEFPETYNFKSSISSDGNLFALAYEARKNKVNIEAYETSGWTRKFSHKVDGFYVPELSFDRDNQFLYFYEEVIDDNEIETLKLLEVDLTASNPSVNEIHRGEFYSQLLVDRSNEKLYFNDGNFLSQLDLKNNEVILKKACSSGNQASYYDRNIDKIVVDAGDYLMLFDPETKEHLAFYFFPDNKSIGITNSGFYMLSPGFPIDHFGFTIDDKGYSFSQFDILFNRPDKVLEFLEFPGQTEIDLYKQAYAKRLSQFAIDPNGLSTNMSDLPKTEFRLEAGSFSTRSPDYPLNLLFTDELTPLASYNVWINGVPFFTSSGEPISGNLNKYKAKLSIPLSAGNNKIEVSCTNVSGLESLRKSVNVYYDKEIEQEKLVFIGIGVSKYADSTYNLSYAAKDVVDMSSYFRSLDESYKTIEVTTLIDEEVTKDRVKALKENLMNTNIEDKVILFYAGHGLLDDKFNYYLSTHTTDFDDPASGGLAYEAFESLLDGIPARKKIMLIDACHSGELDKESIVAVQDEVDSSNVQLGYRGSKSVKVNAEEDEVSAFSLMKNIFSDLRFGTGATVISSASGLEFAYEGEDWKNGVFTYSLLEGLKSGKTDLNGDGAVQISEIQDYVSKKVYNLTNGRQRPTSRTINLELDWRIN